MSKIKDKNIKNIPKVLSEIEIYKRVCEKLVQINTRPRRKLIKFFQNYEGPFKDEILKNFEIASNQQLPLCQDTGIVEFFVWKGYNVIIEKPINEILNKAVKDTYTKMGFRNSVVKDPLLTRQNTLDNTPSIIHIFEIEEPILDIWIIAKGGGSENLSALYMLQPSQGYEGQNGMKDKIIEHVKNNAR
ncbi:MAG: fumarate hydratase, partial [Fervidobacterium sp.]